MPNIGPPGRWAVTAAVLVIAAIAGCGESYDVARRVAAPQGTGAGTSAPAVKSCRFELSPAPLPVSRASWLARIDVGQRFWPKSMNADHDKYLDLRRAVGARAPDWPEARFDRVRFEDYRGPVASAALRLGDRTVFFIARMTSRRSGSPPGSVGGCFHRISMLIDEGERLEQVVVPGVEAGRADAPLEMAAAVVDGRVVLVYASVDSIWAVAGAGDADSFTVSPPGLVRKTHVPAADLQVATAGERAILAWSEPPEAGAPAPLRVVSGAGGIAAWSGVPHTLTGTLRPGTATLLADGRDVYVAWVDLRFDAARAGTGRVMIAPSRDGGAAFDGATLVSDLSDPRDVASRVFIAAADRRLVVFAGEAPGDAWPETWRALTVDASLRTAAPAGQVGGSELVSAYRAAVEPILLGQAPARPPAATETASHPDPVAAEDQ